MKKMTEHRNLAFYTSSYVTVWQGIENICNNNNNNNYAIVGTKGSTGIFYIGPIDASATSQYVISVPKATYVSAYSSNNLCDGKHIIVGSFRIKQPSVKTFGFIFIGRPDQLSDPTLYQTVEPKNLLIYLHSVKGKYIVGNADKISGYNYSFLYNIKTQNELKIKYPGSKTTTSYGITRISKNIYTICGGYSNIKITTKDIINASQDGDADIFPRKAFLVNFDSTTQQFSGWKSFEYPTPKLTTHFEGISFNDNKYQVVCNSRNSNEKNIISWLEIDLNFNVLSWVDIPLNGSNGSGNSVANRYIVGSGVNNNTAIPYQCEIF